MTDQKKPVDAVIVGLGWTGAILAKDLADAGLDVVAIERGPDHSEFPDQIDELEGSVHRKFVQSLKDETVTIRHSLVDTAVPYRQIGSFKHGYGVGGAGAHWSGAHLRALPEDLKLRSYLANRFGKAFLPDDMLVRDFPVSFDDLEKSFDFFEKVCGTTGKAGVINGKAQPGGNPFEGSRSNEYPLPPNPKFPGTRLFETAARNAGYTPFPMPASNASADYVNPYGCSMSACRLSGLCSDYHCPNQAKASPNLNILPALRHLPNFELRTRSQVLRVDLDSSKAQATGVTYIDSTGRTCHQPASIVLLCASPLYTVHLMLVSGIGTAYDPATGQGTIGKYYSYQNVGRINLFFDKTIKTDAYMGIGGAGALFDDLNGKQLDNGKAGFIGGGTVSYRQPGMGPVRGIPLPEGTPQWGREWKQAIIDYFCHSIYFEVQASCMSYHDRYLDLDPNYKDGFGRPLLRMTFDWHENEIKASQYFFSKAKELVRSIDTIATRSNEKADGAKYDATVYQTSHNNGGAVMGDDPHESAVNRYLQSWDVPNVFAIGASAFPQTSAYNPTGLVGALAHWSAQAIRDQYLKDPGPLVQT